MNSKQFTESTTSGAIASVSTPVGKTQTRGKGVYPDEKGGNLLTGKKTNKKFANTVKESNEQGVSEAKLDEEDIIIVPGQGKRLKPGLITKAKDRTDHEVEMALSDLFQSAKNAKHVYELIKDIPETVGIEGWVQEKIIKASDYLNTVREYLEHKQLSEDTIEGKRDNFTVADIKDLEKIRDLETIKARAKELIKGKPDRRMKKEKINYFYNRIDVLTSPLKVIKLMYDLLLAGEGMKTIGSRYSTRANSYQQRFDEMTAEGYRIVPSINKERYSDRSQEGLEGPFRSRNGKVYYYDTKVGRAYDPDTDIYLDLEDLAMENTMHEDVANNQSVDKLIKDNKINLRADMISKDREGNYVFRKGYFYRPSKLDASDWAEMISQKMKELGIDNTVIESDDIWKPFKGGASLKAQSHYLVKIRVNNSEPMSEGLEDDFTSFLQDLEKKSGIKGTIRKPGTPQQPKPAQAPAQAPAPLSADEVSNLKAQLKELEQQFDPEYQRSDDYSYWNKQNSLARQIGQIRKQLRVSGQQMDEGMAAKVGGAVALIAALWGGSEYAAKNAYENSPQLQKLTQYHARATQEGDEAKLREIEKRIKMQKDRLSLGKGEAMDADGKPIVPTYESSHEDELADLSKISDKELNHLVSILGRQQDERSLAAAARGKAELEKRNSGLKKESSIMQGIQFEGSGFKNKVESQQYEYLEQVQKSNLPDWAKEYLMLVNDPKGDAFRASYYSFSKGQKARQEVVKNISNKYGISIDDIERLENQETAKKLSDRMSTNENK